MTTIEKEEQQDTTEQNLDKNRRVIMEVTEETENAAQNPKEQITTEDVRITKEQKIKTKLSKNVRNTIKNL